MVGQNISYKGMLLTSQWRQSSTIS